MVKFVCQYLFSSSRNKQANIGEHLKNRSNFEQRELKFANTWGGGGRARGQKSLQKHSFCIHFASDMQEKHKPKPPTGATKNRVDTTE